MSNSDHTILVEQLLASCAEHLAPIADKMDLPRQIFNDPSFELPEAKFIELLEHAAQQSQTNVGINIGSQVIPAHIGAIGYAFINAGNIQQSLTLLSEYIVTYSHYSEITWQQKERIITVNYRITEPTIIHKQQDAEFALAAIWQLIRNHIDSTFMPLRVEFAHPRPTNVHDHRQLFKCPMRFNSKMNRLVFDAKILNSKLRHADSRLFDVLMVHLQQQKHLRETDRFRQQLSQLVAEQLPIGDFSISHIGKLINLNPRTIQRRLAKLDIEFNQIVIQVRHQLALNYIKEGQLSILQIAEKLGYSETSSFTRAFKRWTGQSPNNYRKNTF